MLRVLFESFIFLERAHRKAFRVVIAGSIYQKANSKTGFKMLSSIKKSISSVYLLYELNTCIYMLDPWEKKFINGVIFSILALLIFSSYVYLPSYTRKLIGAFMPSTTSDLGLELVDHHHSQPLDFGMN
ncbi:uncharacterized protein LOC129744897 [Uranotaenia lowii]|uniref:uncharacterized protein LOC129744897 n=1 Tax=Uranotaenia lowii TaxID=190385 RepID=UPI00247AFE46|nr:uncharacterized protein LOC129744897 [Uranotaenia lowii]